MVLSQVASRLGGPTQGVNCILGGFILCLSFASDFSYPNINTYLTSYMRSNGYNPTLSYADFVLLTTSKVVITGISMPFIGNWAKKIGTRPSIALGSAIYSVGFMLTYFTVKHWFSMAIVSLSCHGIGFSFIYATAIGAAQNWFPPSRKGLVGSIVVSGYGFGSLFWVPLQTMFVNPDNLQAVIDHECEYIGTEQEDAKCDFYFTDENLLEKVPWMFLLLGVVYSIMGVAALCLISDPEPVRTPKSRTKSYRKEKEESLEYLIEDSPGKVAFSLTPLQVIRTPAFYQIWLGFFSISLTNGLMSNYSKTFGLTFINDDHYFAKVAVFLNILNGICRILWGYYYDRFGFKHCFSIIGVTVTLVTATLPALPALGANSLAAKFCYSLWMSVLYATFPGIYSIVAAAVNDAFGPAHYQANFGLLFSQSLAYCAVIMVLTKVSFIHAMLGYTGMFLVAGMFGLVGLGAVSLLPTFLSSEVFREQMHEKN